MTTEIAKNIFRFILLILVQVLIIQNINLSSYVILLPYVLVIILLPFELSRLTVLFISFFLGIIIDYFFDSSGLHASACTLMGFSRYYVLKFISPRDGYDVGVQPTVTDMGLAWFLSYAGTLVLIHHFFFFYLEVFRFSEFFRTFSRAALSSIGTFILIYLLQFLFFTTRKRS
ncbi:MAG: rod shape-determining protein MreD [Bacteroidota bacterium]|nr:rod shape-determining protein MreD [Bacteroidota bacterium]MDP3145120.1 rod shape-determining protein MreD [Bacteroidota bacterium]